MSGLIRVFQLGSCRRWTGTVKKRAVIVVLGLAFIGVCLYFLFYKERPPAQEGRCALRFTQVKSPESSALALAYQRVWKPSQQPSELKDLPEGVSSDASYFLARLCGRDVPVVVDCSKKLKLFLDKNGDGRLSDEKGIVARAIRKSWFGPVEYYRFGPVAMQSNAHSDKSVAKFYIAADERGRALTFYPTGYMSGDVRLGAQVYRVAVVDGSFDGRYDKTASLPFEKTWNLDCDSFALDRNNDRRFDQNYYHRSELVPLAKMFKMADTYYAISLTADAASLELKKIEPQFGTLDVGGADIRLKLWSDAAEQYLCGSAQKWQLPAGRYTALFLELSKLDSRGNNWIFETYRDTGQLRDFEIGPREARSIKIGPPFSIKTKADRGTYRGADEVGIGFNLEGRAGEQYSGRVLKNGQPLAPPKFEIVDEGGKVLYSGKFKYG